MAEGRRPVAWSSDARRRSVTVEIYRGSLIEHGSERTLLRHVVDLLSARNRPAIILANISLGGRQIDLVVALELLTLVLEAKGFSVPVRGSENGTWQYRVASGGWKNFAAANLNPHTQVIQASLALRDAMRSHSGAHVAYPSAALVFVPRIPPGSSISGNFKAEIVGLDALESQLLRSDATEWTLDKWRAFAEARDLVRVDSVEAAFDPLLAAAEQLLGTYTAAFIRTYDPVVRELIRFGCRDGNHGQPARRSQSRGGAS